MSVSVFSNRRNRIGDQIKTIRERQNNRRKISVSWNEISWRKEAPFLSVCKLTTTQRKRLGICDKNGSNIDYSDAAAAHCALLDFRYIDCIMLKKNNVIVLHGTAISCDSGPR